MLQLTSRDEAMLDWMNVVRLADVDAIRWALPAYQDDHDGPVSVRRANHWIARMAELGYLGRTRPIYRDRQIVWPTYQASGRSAPRLFRQTMRHELAVAEVSARYIESGFEWRRDRRSASNQFHLADGLATRGSTEVLIEVELSVKSRERYGRIFESLASRLRQCEVTEVAYFCTPTVSRLVSSYADDLIFREQRSRLSTTPVFDETGRWLNSRLSGQPDADWD